VKPEGSLPHSQVLSLTVSPHDTFLRRGVVSTSPNPQAGGATPCRLSATAYSVHIGDRSSSRSLSTRHVVVTGTHLSRISSSSERNNQEDMLHSISFVCKRSNLIIKEKKVRWESVCDGQEAWGKVTWVLRDEEAGGNEVNPGSK